MKIDLKKRGKLFIVQVELAHDCYGDKKGHILNSVIVARNSREAKEKADNYFFDNSEYRGSHYVHKILELDYITNDLLRKNLIK